MQRGDIIGGHTRLDLRLGRGGMAEVWLGHRKDLGAVVLKFMHPELARQKDMRDRFAKEATIASQLGSRHPGGIVAVRDIGEHEADGETIPYMVMDYVDGVDLRALGRKAQEERVRISVDIVAWIVMQVLEAIHVAQTFDWDGVIMPIAHGDLHPGNVLLTSRGLVRVIDYGIARFVNAAEHESRPIGTLHYMAPEQFLGMVTVQSDLYATAGIAYFLLTGKPPVPRVLEHAQVLQFVMNGTPAPIERDDVPAQMHEFLARAFEKDMSRRLRTAHEGLDLLEPLVSMTTRRTFPSFYARVVGRTHSGMTNILKDGGAIADDFAPTPILNLYRAHRAITDPKAPEPVPEPHEEEHPWFGTGERAGEDEAPARTVDPTVVIQQSSIATHPPREAALGVRKQEPRPAPTAPGTPLVQPPLREPTIRLSPDGPRIQRLEPTEPLSPSHHEPIARPPIRQPTLRVQAVPPHAVHRVDVQADIPTGLRGGEDTGPALGHDATGTLHRRGAYDVEATSPLDSGPHERPSVRETYPRARAKRSVAPVLVGIGILLALGGTSLAATLILENRWTTSPPASPPAPAEDRRDDEGLVRVAAPLVRDDLHERVHEDVATATPSPAAGDDGTHPEDGPVQGGGGAPEAEPVHETTTPPEPPKPAAVKTAPKPKPVSVVLLPQKLRCKQIKVGARTLVVDFVAKTQLQPGRYPIECITEDGTRTPAGTLEVEARHAGGKYEVHVFAGETKVKKAQR